MEFNEHWTKEVNDEYRQMIKEHKSLDEIREHFKDVLKYHPNHKFEKKKILSYGSFLNEIKINPSKVDYLIDRRKSNINDNFFDYKLSFSIEDENDYVLILEYQINDAVESYNILFTTKKQYEEYIKTVENILALKGKINKNDIDFLRDVIEKETNYNEIIPLMKKLSYIMFSFSPNITYAHPNILFAISDTENYQKIKLYRNIIESSFKNVEEIFDEKNKIYYYKINDVIF